MVVCKLLKILAGTIMHSLESDSQLAWAYCRQKQSMKSMAVLKCSLLREVREEWGGSETGKRVGVCDVQ